MLIYFKQAFNHMKKIISLTFLMATLLSHAQAPEGINYQAVVRDNLGTPIENSLVSLKIAIYQSSTSGLLVFGISKYSQKF